VNLMKFNKTKCKHKPRYEYRLGDEGIESRPAENHRITESQNSRGWKGPLWVI